MELRERLRGLGYFRPTPTQEARPAERPPVRHSLPEIHEVVEGTHRSCSEGDCFVSSARYPLDHVHAGVAISDLLGHGGHTFATLTGDARLAALDPARAVLLDIETTGLAGGTGTYVFLVGLGYFAEGAFHLEQFFLRDPSQERAFLRVLGASLGRFDAVITFNGKCFDWPLVENRHHMMRVPLRPTAPLHVDLLFPARRLFKRRIGSCSLDALEQSVLGLGEREGDVPGWLIPTLYFDYLRCRDARPLARIFMHNRRDLLSMLALGVRLASHVADPLGSAPDEASDLLGLGRLFEDRGAPDTAIQCYERALQLCVDTVDRAEALARLAGAYKRLREAERAVELWESLIAEGAVSIYPYVELAKYLEHRERAFDRALELTRRAMGLCGGARDHADLGKRLARLERKLGARSALVPS